MVLGVVPAAQSRGLPSSEKLPFHLRIHRSRGDNQMLSNARATGARAGRSSHRSIYTWPHLAKWHVLATERAKTNLF